MPQEHKEVKVKIHNAFSSESLPFQDTAVPVPTKAELPGQPSLEWAVRLFPCYFTPRASQNRGLQPNGTEPGAKSVLWCLLR